MSEWISTKDNLPPYGEPVLIMVHGFVQNITYARDGADDCSDLIDWFEPYFFEHDYNCKLSLFDVTHWMPLPPPEDAK